jgi:uncharacterized membrane protein
VDNLVSVRAIDDDHSQWVAKGPGGTEVKWNSMITEDISGAFIAWQNHKGWGYIGS